MGTRWISCRYLPWMLDQAGLPHPSRKGEYIQSPDEKPAAFYANRGAPALQFTSQLVSFGIAKLDSDYSLSAVQFFEFAHSCEHFFIPYFARCHM